MKITNVNVYGLKESLKASKYPMSVDTDSMTDSITKTIKSLGSCINGTGHDSALKGIIVQYDLTCNHVMLPQFMRYHFHDIISSQSKMHKITQMDLAECCDKYVANSTIKLCKEMIKEYNDMKNDGCNQEDLSEQYERIMSNLPMGLELTMRVTSNYLQMKSIHLQRRNHKMSFWKEYCKWIETLPMFKEIVLKGDNQ